MNKAEFLSRFITGQLTEPQPEYPLRKTAQPAAVLIPVVLRPQLTVLFTRRADHLRHHAGQVSFPGGRFEPGDGDLRYTALREAHEEIDLAPEQVEVIGRLPAIKTISGFQVTPYVGFIAADLPLQADHNEVAEVFEVPLSFLLDEQYHQQHWITRRQQAFAVNLINWHHHTIWGLTASIVKNLTNILQSH